MIPIRYTISFLLLWLPVFIQVAQAQCTTEAGTINTNSQSHCENEGFAVTHNGNQTLDANDVLQFVAYTGSTPNAGTVFATSATGVFAWQPEFLTNSPFKVAAVAGDNAGGTVDWNDPCLSVSGAATVTYLPPPVIAANGGILTCNTTSISVTASANQPNCFFAWSNNENGSTIFLQQPGIYCVTVTNQAGCTASTCVTIEQDITMPVANAGLDVTLTCNIPVITLDPVGSSQGPFFTYTWIGPVGFTSDLMNPQVSQSGTYTLVVTNVLNGCTATDNMVVLEDFLAPVFNVIPPVTLNCAATFVVLDVSGPPQFIYFWTGPNGFVSNIPNPTVSEPGIYMLTVINPANGCQATATVVVTQDANPPVADAGPDMGIPCGGGVVTLNGSASSPGANFTYQWTGPGIVSGASTLNPVVNIPGIYTLIVINTTNGCTDTDELTVFAGPVIPLQNFAVTPASCQGLGNGSIDMTPPAAAQPPLTFAWTGPNAFVSNTEDINGLIAGVYSVVVTDATGCSYYANVAVGTNVLIVSTPVIVQPVSCHGFSDGAITLNVSGGTPPYLYSWTPAIIVGPNPGNLPAGTYTVTITDSGGCSATQSITIIEPVALVVSASLINCGSTTAQAAVSGGAPPYAYLWSNGSTAPIIQGLTPGIYFLTIYDANGCSASASVTVGTPNNPFCGHITGQVQRDSLNNCAPDMGEAGLLNWIVRADNSGGNSFYGSTDSAGTYHISVEAGDYTLTLTPPNALWAPCTTILPIGAVAANQTVTAPAFLVQPAASCPALSVFIGTSLLRRCFSNNYYYLNYCNYGTAPAKNAYVLVTLDPFMLPIEASIPYTNLGNNVLRFNVGDVGIGACGAFSLRVQISCNAALGQTHCTEAHIFPDTSCLTPNAQWSGASLRVSSECDGDSVRFIIQNIGSGDMTETSDYIVIEDAVMLMKAPVQLDAGQSTALAFPANGSTWRVEVEQVPFHPGNSQPALSVEGCSVTSSFSTGFITQFSTNDADPWIDIDCTPNIGSYDPNDKQGFPVGYGAAHYIRPGTELEYLIRFQNTGTDTAFTVRITDTLPAWLDPASIRPGTASHPYRFDLSGQGIATFLFENILLPDSNVNQAGSNGFVKFSILPKAEAPLETVIENEATIYFDFNEPVITNSTYHRLGENFLVAAWQPFVPGATLRVSPNPFGDAAVLEVKGLRNQAPIRLQIFDLQGTVLQELETSGAIFDLRKDDWPAGIYLFSVFQEGRIVGSGKFAVK